MVCFMKHDSRVNRFSSYSEENEEKVELMKKKES